MGLNLALIWLMIGESIDLQPVVDVPLFQKTAKKVIKVYCIMHVFRSLLV